MSTEAKHAAELLFNAAIRLEAVAHSTASKVDRKAASKAKTAITRLAQRIGKIQ